VVPQAEFEVQQLIQSRMQDNGDTSSTTLEHELLELLEQESSSFINKFDKFNRQPVPYYHPMQFLHVQSSKYLTISSGSQTNHGVGEGLT
jgi:pyruvate/2-oxoacid:ferredoxin oxidoreductase alpha subunit